jgi:hypothetical protein
LRQREPFDRNSGSSWLLEGCSLTLTCPDLFASKQSSERAPAMPATTKGLKVELINSEPAKRWPGQSGDKVEYSSLKHVTAQTSPTLWICWSVCHPEQPNRRWHFFLTKGLCRACQVNHDDTSFVVIGPFSMEILPLGRSTAAQINTLNQRTKSMLMGFSQPRSVQLTYDLGFDLFNLIAI